jgi:hypothetical protein
MDSLILPLDQSVFGFDLIHLQSAGEEKSIILRLEGRKHDKGARKGRRKKGQVKM